MSIARYCIFQIRQLGWLFLAALTSRIGHVMVLAFGLACICWGIIELQRGSQVGPQQCPVCPNQAALQLQEAVTNSAQTATQAATSSQLVIDVAGAVNKPGLYAVSASARVADAITQAGGFSSKADTYYIAQKLNLASPLTPNSKVYIPSQGEQWNVTDSIVTEAAPQPTQALTTTSPSININSASKSELMELPGIGEVTAQKIISNRPYQTVTELLDKNVTSESVYNKIVARITAQ